MKFKNKKILSIAVFFATATCAQASLNTEEDTPQYSWKISTKVGVVQTIDGADGTKSVNMGFMTGKSIRLDSKNFNDMLAPLNLSASMTLEEATAALRVSGLVD